MPDIKEKLVEMIRCADYHPCRGAVRTIGSTFTTDFIQDIASHLIAHGVTVQECKVGDVVYCLYKECQKETKVIELEIDSIEIYKDYTILQGFIGEHCYRYFTKEIGKAVFLTKEQAEAHLPQPPKGE